MKKKILIIVPNLKIGGGQERAASLLTKGLSKKYKVFIITYNNYKNHYSIKGEHFSLNEKLRRYGKIPIIPNIIRPFRIFKLILFLKPDIILSIGDFSNIFIIITKLLFRINITLIIAIHVNPKMQYYKNRASYLNYLIKILYRLKTVNKIITVSKEIQYILSNDYKIQVSKLKTIYNGIETDEIKKKKVKKILEHNEIFDNKSVMKFITIGRLSEEKGHKYLIDAFSKVKKEIENSKLILIGSGPLKHILEMQIKRKALEEDIILLGLKKNPYKYLGKSDIFVFSSKNEGFPTVLLESLACGLPIISTDCKTGPKEILNNGRFGFLVKVMDVDDLAEKMIYLAKNPNLIKIFSKKSIERAKFFDVEKMISEWINLIELYINK